MKENRQLYSLSKEEQDRVDKIFKGLDDSQETNDDN